MGRDLRLLLYTGIHLSGYYVPLDDVAWIRSLLGLPLNQRGQVVLACPELVEGTLQAMHRIAHSFTRR